MCTRRALHATYCQARLARRVTRRAAGLILPPPAWLCRYIAVLVDLANAILLTFFALRQKTINVRDGLYFGALAALPALPSAILSTRYLPQFEELIKQVSGYGLFGFGLIFAVRGLRMHARRLKQEGDEVEPLLRRKGSRGSKSSQGSRGSLDDSDRRASITATPKRLSSSGLPEDIARRGIARYKIIVCAAAVAAAGVFAGFVGFGNGMLFATAVSRTRFFASSSRRCRARTRDSSQSPGNP